MNFEEKMKKYIEDMELARRRDKFVGVCMAFTAVLLATSALASHREHTHEVVIEGDRNTQWANYDRKRSVQHVYESDAKIASLLNGGKEIEEEFTRKANLERDGDPANQKEGTEIIRRHAHEIELMLPGIHKRAKCYDLSELFLELSIVLCSISLLAESRIYCYLSFGITAIGVAVGLFGFLGVH